MTENPFDGWFQRLEKHADLDRTLKEIRGVNSWRAKVVVARVLSLQCHKDEADEAFAAAWEQEPEAGSCLQTLVRKHLARQFELEHELVLGDAGRTDPLDLTLLAAASDGNDFAATALPGLKALNASRDLYVGNFG